MERFLRSRSILQENSRLMHRSSSCCPGPVSRRSFLEAGSLLLGGLWLSDLLRLRAEAAGKVDPDTSILLIWLQGGPSHADPSPRPTGQRIAVGCRQGIPQTHQISE